MNFKKSFLILVWFSFLSLSLSINNPVFSQTCTDADGDGYGVNGDPSCTGIGVDCDDTDDTVHPGAQKICDGKDNNCDGKRDFTTDVDADGDGVPWCASDCNDNNDQMYPGNTEGPYGDPKCTDGLDNNCNGVPESQEPLCLNPCIDVDGDGYGLNGHPLCPLSGVDCDDNNAARNPALLFDLTCDGFSDDCDGLIDEDYVPDTSCGTGECNTNNTPSICDAGGIETACEPGLPVAEDTPGTGLCIDGLDNDCDGEVDNPLGSCYINNPDKDDDGDGYCEAGCTDGSIPGDCDDNNAARNPGAVDDTCDGFSDDCDGPIDEDYVIIDDCGIGECGNPLNTTHSSCSGGVETACIAGSPVDENDPVDPTCSDGLDNDCNGVIDNPTDCIDNPLDIDNDGDNYCEVAPCQNTTPTTNGNDCDDTDPTMHPGAQKICDAKDNNCDGKKDFTTDEDKDGDGVPWCANDCNDNNDQMYPGIPFDILFCTDSLDNNCDGLADENDPDECPPDPCIDMDGDGYGFNGDPSCPNGTEIDCDDNNASIHPGASDANCNGVDDNCSGTPDDGYVPDTSCGTGVCGFPNNTPSICNPDGSITACQPGPADTEGPPGDPTCTDTEDNDCDGLTDAADIIDCFVNPSDTDDDADGYCEGPTCSDGSTPGDCNDFDDTIHPGVPDAICDGVDDNCSGTPDDGYVPDTSCGTGVCGFPNNTPSICNLDGSITPCQPGPAGVEGPATDPTCFDGEDNDCDTLTDAADTDDCVDNPLNVDNDGDNYCEVAPCLNTTPTSNGGDCDDTDPLVHPGAIKICDGKDNNCDGKRDFTTDVDADGDGVPWCGNDCDDNNDQAYPGNTPEGPFGDPTCFDNADNECDGLTDNNDPGCGIPCIDADEDGYGLNGDPSCTFPGEADCDDNNAAINPGVLLDSTCDGFSDDCDGQIDEDYVPDTSCGLGVCGSPNNTPSSCGAGGNETACIPGPAGIEAPPGSPSCTDGLDNDCDGEADNPLGSCYINDPDKDDDGDGYCEAGCTDGSIPGDCDDSNAAVNPAGDDANCNGIDEDCSGTADDQYVPDTSCGTGECGFPNNTPSSCIGGVETACIEGLPAPEDTPFVGVCLDGLDNDCDGSVDQNDLDCFDPCADDDGDGYCQGGPGCGGTCIPGDCDPLDPNVFPGAPKICDGKDSNCDGKKDFATDEDKDNDGSTVCVHWQTGLSDCDDNDPLVYPGNTEGPWPDPTCTDGKDNDCDGTTDCPPLTCDTGTSPRSGPHSETMRDPGPDGVPNTGDDIDHPENTDLLCGKCHGINFTDPVRDDCFRCHTAGGQSKIDYPDPWPFGFGSAPDVMLHSSTVLGTKYGAWDMTCSTCHNPHIQEQDDAYGTTYGKLIKQYICFDNTSTGGGYFEEIVEFTAASGAGSFADGPPHNSNVCEMCHTQTLYHRNDGATPAHNDGTDCAECHLHSEGFKPSCGSCHAIPPATGSHLKHFGGLEDFAAYGDTGITQDYVGQGTDYIMNCGNCHPVDSANHQNSVLNAGGGNAEIELYNPNAPAGSLKLLNPPTAAYTPGATIYTDVDGLNYTTGTCDNVYCHSVTDFSTSGDVPEPTPYVFPTVYNPPWQSFVVTSTAYNTTPVWGTSSDTDGLMCNNCHGYPIQTEFPTVSAGVGDSHVWKNDFGEIDLHMWNMARDPLQCNTCHYDTVQDSYTWFRDDVSIELLTDIPIYNTALHVNGEKDVSFTPVPVPYPAISGIVYHDLNTATYDAPTRTCFNVSCHKAQTEVIWGAPYRYWNSTECDVCHRFL